MNTRTETPADLATKVVYFLAGAGIYDGVTVQTLPWEEGDTPTCALSNLSDTGRQRIEDGVMDSYFTVETGSTGQIFVKPGR